jgi:ABC-type Co2+ transport system permease subunit
MNLSRPHGPRARSRPLALHLCFAQLHSRTDWLQPWFAGWVALFVWAAFAFLAAPAPIAIAAQATFFAGLFLWILLPVAVAAGRERCAAR